MYYSSKVIDSCKPKNDQQKLAYFYSLQDDANRNNPEMILRTIIQQLAQTADGKIHQPVMDIYKNLNHVDAFLGYDAIKKLLVDLTNLHETTTICIDALDEVNKTTRKQLLESLTYVVNNSKKPVKVFATARMDDDIIRWQASPSTDKFLTINLTGDDTMHDINFFIQSQIDQQLLPYIRKGLHLRFKAIILDVLCPRCKGM